MITSDQNIDGHLYSSIDCFLQADTMGSRVITIGFHDICSILLSFLVIENKYCTVAML